MKRLIHLLAVEVLTIMTNHVHAAWLYACDAQQAGGTADTASTFITRPDSTRLRIAIGAKPPADCAQRQIAVAAEMVEALQAIPAAVASRLGKQLTMVGEPGPAGFQIESVDDAAAAPSAARAPLPLATNLLPAMRVRSYGIEERTDVRIEDGKLLLQCRAGSKPAGVLLMQEASLSMARADLVLSGSGQGRFELKVADAAHAAREAAVTLGEFSADAAPRTARYPANAAGVDESSWQFFVLGCPLEAASLTLDSMTLQPRNGAVQPRSSWIWNPNEWQQNPQAVFALAERYALKVLFVSVPVASGAVAQADALAAFIRDARNRGIAVWAVAGDPHMVLPAEQAVTVERMRAYAAYNASVAAAEALAGVQFDVEPYLLPGYALAEAQWSPRYVELVAALKQAGRGLPLEMVVPYWWADRETLLDEIAPHVDGLSVMDYRTRRDEIVRFATPFLDWGVRHKKAIRIALEAGPVGEETIRQYVRADRGELWQSEIAGIPVVLLLKSPQAHREGAAWRYVASRVQDGSATSFHRDPAALIDMAPGLENIFSAWSSFNGLALHESK
jgi:hypothetical protein